MYGLVEVALQHVSVSAGITPWTNPGKSVPLLVTAAASFGAAGVDSYCWATARLLFTVERETLIVRPLITLC